MGCLLFGFFSSYTILLLLHALFTVQYVVVETDYLCCFFVAFRVRRLFIFPFLILIGSAKPMLTKASFCCNHNNELQNQSIFFDHSLEIVLQKLPVTSNLFASCMPR